MDSLREKEDLIDSGEKAILESSASLRFRLGSLLEQLDTKGLELSVREDASRTTLGMKGRLDHRTGPFLKRVLEECALQNGRRVVELDLSQVFHIDGVGLASLVWGHRRVAESGGRMLIASLQHEARVIIEKTHLHHVFEIGAS